MTDTFWMNRPVFVTGATGLLGSALTTRLVDAGAVVVCLVRDGVPRSNFYLTGLDQRVTVVRGCLEDYALLERTLNEYEIDTVFHLGAQTIVGYANRSPMATFEANIRGTWHLLEACRTHAHVHRIVASSSDKAYGIHETLPYQEDAQLQGRYPYDASKSCMDLLCQSYVASFDLPVCVMRCANLFGAGDLNFNRIVPGTIWSALHGTRPIVRSDGTLVRDYLYVAEAAEAFLLAASRLEEAGISGEAFNVSYERPLTVLEMVRMILDVVDRTDLEPEILNQAANEIPSQYLASQKIRDRLGWEPRYTLETGLRETVAWYRGRFAAEGRAAGLFPAAGRP